MTEPLLDCGLIVSRRLGVLKIGRKRLAREMGWWSERRVESLERGENHDQLSGGEIVKLAGILGVEPAALVNRTGTAADPADPATPAEMRDAQKVHALLAHAGRRLTRDALAQALGFDARRIDRAIRALSAMLEGTALTLVIGAGGVLVSVRAGLVDEAETKTLLRQVFLRDPLDYAESRMLRRIATGEIVKDHDATLSYNERVCIDALLRYDMVVRHADGRIEVAPGTAFSLRMTTASQAGLRKRSAGSRR